MNFVFVISLIVALSSLAIISPIYCVFLLLACLAVLGISQIIKKPYVAGIPIIPNDSMFGYLKTFFAPNGLSYAFALRDAEKYGRIGLAQHYALGQHIVAVYDSRLAKEVMKSVHGKGFFHRGDKNVTHRNILNLDTGPDWQLRRSAFRHAFAAHCLRTQEEMIRLLSDKLSCRLQEHAMKGETVEIDRIFGQISIDVICEAAFQLKINALDDSAEFKIIQEALFSFMQVAWVGIVPFASILLALPIPFGPLKKYNQCKIEIKSAMKKILDHIQQLNSRNELRPNSLAKAFIEFSELPSITEADVLEEIRLFFLAGHETTAHTLSFVVYALAANPDVQLQAQHEMDEHNRTVSSRSTGNNNNNDNYNTTSTNSSTQFNRNSLPILPAYVEAVIKETMRRYPVANSCSKRLITAEKGQSLTLSNGRTVIVPKDSYFIVNPYALHNSCHNWGEDAMVFDPTRWLNNINDSSASDNAQPETSADNEKFSVEISLNARVAVDDADPLAESVAGADGSTSLGDGNLTSVDSKLSSSPDSSVSSTPVVNVNPLASSAIYAGGGAQSDQLSFSPFSFGVRNCIGMNLALLELRVVTADLLTRFSFALADESMLSEEKAVEQQFTLRPRNKLPVLVSARSPSIVK